MRAIRGMLLVVRALAAILVDTLRHSRRHRSRPSAASQRENEVAQGRGRAATPIPSIAETSAVAGSELAGPISAPGSESLAANQEDGVSLSAAKLHPHAQGTGSALTARANGGDIPPTGSDPPVDARAPGTNPSTDALGATGESCFVSASAGVNGSETLAAAVVPLSTELNGIVSDVEADLSAREGESNTVSRDTTEASELVVAAASPMTNRDLRADPPVAHDQEERDTLSIEPPELVAGSDSLPAALYALEPQRAGEEKEVATVDGTESSVPAGEGGPAQARDESPDAADVLRARDTVERAEHDDQSVRAEYLAAGTNVLVPAISRRSKRPQYRPTVQAPPSRSVVRRNTEKASNVERALRIELRLRMEHGGFCSVSLLARRDATLPDALSVTVDDALLGLLALQEDWYQDVVRDDLGELMRRGMEWEGRRPNGESVRWALSGRDVFVLMRHNQLSGFVTTPRLVLGESHVVLCAKHRASDVKSCLEACGCAGPVQFDDTFGAPSGWIGFRDVVPKVSVKPSATGDILDALCPQPDVEIVLSGGIRLERSTWLTGFPPRIRLHGDVTAAGDVWIDGRLASIDPTDGAYVGERWDWHGDHQVWCAGKSVSYSIANGDEDWEPWDAYRWSFGEVETTKADSRPSICGVLALPPVNRGGAPNDARSGVVVPATNPVLLGAVPGEIYIASRRSDLHARTCTAFPEFEPIWALPLAPLQSDKRSARVLVVGALKEPARSRSIANAMRWSDAIIAASRKGLLTDPQSADAAAAWEQYRQAARAFRRRAR